MNFGTVLAEGPAWEPQMSGKVREPYPVGDVRALLGTTRSEEA